MQEEDNIWVARQRAGTKDLDENLPAWKAAVLRNRMNAATNKAKTTDTVKRAQLAEDPMAEVRRAKACTEPDERRLVAAPSGKRTRFDRCTSESAACAPTVLSLLTELLGMRTFGTLSEVCTEWHDGVCAKEEEWAVLSIRLGSGLGLGTGPAAGQLDLPTYATVCPGNAVCVCDSGNSRLQAFSPQGRVKGELPLGRGTRAGHLSMPCSVYCDESTRSLFVVVSDGTLLKFRVLHGPAGGSLKFERSDPRADKARGRGAKREGGTGGGGGGGGGGGSSRDGQPPATSMGGGGWECPSCTYLHTAAEAGSRKCVRCEQPRPKTPALEAMAVEAPEGCAILDGTLFVTCARWHRIVAFSTETLQPLRSFGSHGRGLGQLRFPQGMAALRSPDPEQQELFVADMHNDRIAIFTPLGACLGEVGFRGHGPGQFIYPRGVALVRDELLVVRNELLVVAERQRVQVLTLLGQPRQVLRVAGAERLAGICTATRQVTWTGRRPLSQAFLYVVDMDGGRVHELAVSGRTATSWEHPTELHTTLGSIRLDKGRRHAAENEGEEGDVAAASAAVGGDAAADAPADASATAVPLSAAMRAAMAARERIAAERAAQLQQSRTGDADQRQHKVRQRTKLLSRVRSHPRGELGTALRETLELPSNATDAAVDHAIRLVMRVLHPDFSINREARGSKLGKDLQAAFQKIADLRDRLQAEREQQRAEEEAEEFS